MLSELDKILAKSLARSIKESWKRMDIFMLNFNQLMKSHDDTLWLRQFDGMWD